VVGRKASRIQALEGEVVAIPIARGLWAMAVVARVARRDYALLLYCFGPAATLSKLREDMPAQSRDLARPILVGIASDLAIRGGRWKKLGTIPEWKSSDWPIPVFFRTESNGELTYLVSYNEKLEVVEESLMKGGKEGKKPLWECGSMGSKYVELVLRDLLLAHR
jgi:hypothetical protein